MLNFFYSMALKGVVVLSRGVARAWLARNDLDIWEKGRIVDGSAGQCKQ